MHKKIKIKLTNKDLLALSVEFRIRYVNYIGSRIADNVFGYFYRTHFKYSEYVGPLEKFCMHLPQIRFNNVRDMLRYTLHAFKDRYDISDRYVQREVLYGIYTYVLHLERGFERDICNKFEHEEILVERYGGFTMDYLGKYIVHEEDGARYIRANELSYSNGEKE